MVENRDQTSDSFTPSQNQGRSEQNIRVSTSTSDILLVRGRYADLEIQHILGFFSGAGEILCRLILTLEGAI